MIVCLWLLAARAGMAMGLVADTTWSLRSMALWDFEAFRPTGFYLSFEYLLPCAVFITQGRVGAGFGTAVGPASSKGSSFSHTFLTVWSLWVESEIGVGSILMNLSMVDLVRGKST